MIYLEALEVPCGPLRPLEVLFGPSWTLLVPFGPTQIFEQQYEFGFLSDFISSCSHSNNTELFQSFDDQFVQLLFPPPHLVCLDISILLPLPGAEPENCNLTPTHVPVLAILVSVLVQPVLIVSTCLPLRFIPSDCLWQDHVVVYPLPPADSVQHSLVHPIVHYQVSHPTADHLTPA